MNRELKKKITEADLKACAEKRRMESDEILENVYGLLMMKQNRTDKKKEE